MRLKSSLLSTALRRGRAPVGAHSALLVLVVAAIGQMACNSAEESPAPTLDSPTENVDARTINALDEPVRLISLVVAEVPGFAGLALDSQEENSYVITATYPEISSTFVKTAILRHDPTLAESFETASFTIEVLEFDTSRLSEWYEQLNDRVVGNLPPDLRTSRVWSDLDEVHNQVIIGFEEESTRILAQELILEKLDAPPGVVVAIPAVFGPDD